MRREIMVLLAVFMSTALVLNCQATAEQEKQKGPRDVIHTSEPEKEGSDELVIRITDPKEGALVPWRPYVKGTVTDPEAEVWVIVHPMEVSDYWVQPSVNVKEGGTWKVCVFIGEPGDAHVGKLFEILAVANPNEELFEGKVLKGWPDAQSKSQIVEVTRK